MNLAEKYVFCRDKIKTWPQTNVFFQNKISLTVGKVEKDTWRGYRITRVGGSWESKQEVEGARRRDLMGGFSG